MNIKEAITEYLNQNYGDRITIFTIKFLVKEFKEYEYIPFDFSYKEYHIVKGNIDDIVAECIKLVEYDIPFQSRIEDLKKVINYSSITKQFNIDMRYKSTVDFLTDELYDPDMLRRQKEYKLLESV